MSSRQKAVGGRQRVQGLGFRVQGWWGGHSCLPLSLCFALIAGCTSSKPAPATQGASQSPAVQATKGKKNGELNKWLQEVEVAVPPSTYRVQPPDAIKITAPAVKELDKAVA